VKAIRDRLGVDDAREAGLTLIEVVVAMVIFTIITTGLLYTMVSLLTITRDSRARQVATNLASQEIDLARDIGDIFSLVERNRDVAINGDTFHIKRTAHWVTNISSSDACGSGGGTLRFKRVKVTVVWDGLRSGSKGVESDTLINPNERISDPALGTILVSVKTGAGEAVANVPVTAKLTDGTGPTLTGKTDSQGCAFFLRVAPGQYTTSISSPSGFSYVDVDGNASPSKTAAVAAGTSAAVPFFYDKSGTFTASYTNTGGAVLPTNMPTTLLSTRDPSVFASTTAANPKTLAVYPWPDGYSVIAGNVPACAAADPGLWAAAGAKGEGTRPNPYAALSGVNTPVAVSAGTVRVNNLGSGTKYVLIKSISVPTAGQPGCATEQIYRYASTNSSNLTITIPYGTWEIHKSTVSGFTPTVATRVASSNFVVGLLTAILGGNNTITADPRPAA